MVSVFSPTKVGFHNRRDWRPGAVEGDRRYYTVGIERAGEEVSLRFVWTDLESFAIEGCMQKGARIVLLLLFLILFFGVSSVCSLLIQGENGSFTFLQI